MKITQRDVVAKVDINAAIYVVNESKQLEEIV